MAQGTLRQDTPTRDRPGRSESPSKREAQEFIIQVQERANERERQDELLAPLQQESVVVHRASPPYRGTHAPPGRELWMEAQLDALLRDEWELQQCSSWLDDGMLRHQASMRALTANLAYCMKIKFQAELTFSEKIDELVAPFEDHILEGNPLTFEAYAVWFAACVLDIRLALSLSEDEGVDYYNDYDVICELDLELDATSAEWHFQGDMGTLYCWRAPPLEAIAAQAILPPSAPPSGCGESLRKDAVGAEKSVAGVMRKGAADDQRSSLVHLLPARADHGGDLMRTQDGKYKGAVLGAADAALTNNSNPFTTAGVNLRAIPEKESTIADPSVPRGSPRPGCACACEVPAVSEYIELPLMSSHKECALM